MARYNLDDELRPWTAAAGQVSQAMLALPQLRAQLARQRESDAQSALVNQARVRHYDAETERSTAETGKTREEVLRLARVGAATERLGANFPKLVQAMQTGDFSDPNADATIGDMAIITGDNKDDLGALLKSVTSGAFVARQGTNLTPEAGRRAAFMADPNKAQAQDVRENIAKAGVASREKIARTKPITVSRDSGIWNPETQSFDVPKPDRPAGNANNLYDPATRQALVSLGEKLAAAIASDDDSEVAEIQAQIARAKGEKPPPPNPVAAGSVMDVIRRMSAAKASERQAQDPDDPGDGGDEDVIEPTPHRSAVPAGATPAATAGVGQIPKIQNRADADELMRQAQQAIADGYDPAAVKAKLTAALTAAGYTLTNTNAP